MHLLLGLHGVAGVPREAEDVKKFLFLQLKETNINKNNLILMLQMAHEHPSTSVGVSVDAKDNDVSEKGDISTLSSSFFKESAVEKDIHQRYLDMDHSEKEYEQAQEDAIKNLKIEQKHVFSSGDTDEKNPEIHKKVPLEEPLEVPLPEGAETTDLRDFEASFKQKLMRFRQEKLETSYSSSFPSAAELEQQADKGSVSLKQKLMKMRAKNNEKQESLMDSDTVVSYPLLLNPEDIAQFKRHGVFAKKIPTKPGILQKNTPKNW